MATMGDYKLQGLRDSRLYYMRNPPKFMTYTILIIVLILVGVAVWSCTAVKAEEVENSGIVVDSGVKSITNDVAGTIIEVYAREGDLVAKDGILFVLDSSVAEAERRNYENSLKHYENRLSLISEFMDAVENDKPNPFVNMGDEREFYEMMKSYENELEQTTYADQKETVRMKYLNNLYSQKTSAEKDIKSGLMYQELYDASAERISKINRLLAAASESGGPGNNPFVRSSEKDFYEIYAEFYQVCINASFISGYGDYYKSSTIKDFYNTWYNTKANLEKELIQYDSYVKQGEKAEDRLERIDTMINSLNRDTTSNPFIGSSTEPVEVEFYDLFNQYLAEYNQNNLDNKQEYVKLKYLSSIRSENSNAKDQTVQLKAQIASAEANIAKYTIRAANTGTVHYDLDVEVGSYVQTGAAIGNINSGSDKQIEMVVNAHDRVRLAVGQECRFTVDGLLQTEFGCVNGKIHSIADDATITKEGAFFKIRVSFDDQALIDDKGNQIEILNGMSVKTWTIYEKNTYMDYFLDGLGF